MLRHITELYVFQWLHIYVYSNGLIKLVLMVKLSILILLSTAVLYYKKYAKSIPMHFCKFNYIHSVTTFAYYVFFSYKAMDLFSTITTNCQPHT